MSENELSMYIENIKPAFSDDRGHIFDILTDENIRHVGFFTIKSNSIRGKHYHKEQKQFTFVYRGQVKVRTKNLLEPNSKIQEFDLKEMDLIVFPAYCYHEMTGIKDSECMVFTSKGRGGDSYEEDTFRVEDIESFELSQK